MQKYNKHIDDLKRYYESRIVSLQNKLSAASKKSPPTTPRRVLDFDGVQSSPVPVTPSPHNHHHCQQTGELTETVALAKVKTYQAENARLESECTKLKDMLEKSRR